MSNPPMDSIEEVRKEILRHLPFAEASLEMRHVNKIDKLLTTFASRIREEKKAGQLEYLLEMFDRWPEKESRFNRWLGFVQGALWSLGVVEIGQLKSDNRGKQPIERLEIVKSHIVSAIEERREAKGQPMKRIPEERLIAGTQLQVEELTEKPKDLMTWMQEKLITERILHNRAKKEIAELIWMVEYKKNQFELDRAELERMNAEFIAVKEFGINQANEMQSELASLKEKLEKVEGSLAQIADCLNQELRENNTGHIQVTDYLNSDFRPMIRILVDRVKMYSTPQTGR